MSFEEIGRQLGMSRGRAWQVYESGMQKLRHPKNRKLLESMVAVARLKGIKAL